MNIRLFCVLGILLCMVISWLAPHYLNACKIIGYGFLGMAVISCFIERDSNSPPLPERAPSEQE